MNCVKCGKELPEGAAFCPSCGEKIRSEHGQNMPDAPGLVSRARNGDQQAIAALYEQTYNKVYYTVKSMIRNEDDVFDVLQDSYIKAFSHLDSFEGDGKFLPWVRQIAANTARDWLKKKRPMLFSELSTEEDTDVSAEERIEEDRAVNLPEQLIEQEETKRLMREIIEDLPEDQRAVIGMYYYEELSVKEIALAMGITESAVKSRLLYGRRKIEKKVRELEKKGTKLYGLAPIPFLLLLYRNLDKSTGQVPNNTILQRVLAAGPNGAAVGGTIPAAAAGTTSGTAAAASAAAGGLGAVKIALIAVAAAAVIGGGIFGATKLHDASASRKDAAVPEPSVIEVQPSTEVIPEEETAIDTERDEQTAEDTEESYDPEEKVPDPEENALAEIYWEVIEKAPTYDYGNDVDYKFGGKPTGIYHYALVTLQEGDEAPALLLTQETDNGKESVILFTYDAGMLDQLSGIIEIGAGNSDPDFFLSTGRHSTGLQMVSVLEGEEYVRKIISKDKSVLVELIWSGKKGQEPDSPICETIEWFDITDSAGLESLAGLTVSSETDILPEDGDRLVLAGTVDIITYEEAVELQGYPDYNAADKGQTWVVVRLDSPQMLEGSQDVSTWKHEHSVILISTTRSSGQKYGEDTLTDYVEKHVVFSAGSFSKASDTSVPIGVPWAHDIHVLKVDD